MFTRDIERLVRSLAAQKTGPDYIRHYLQDTYQLDNATIDKVFTKLGVPLKTDAKGKHGKSAQPGDDQRANQRNRQGF